MCIRDRTAFTRGLARGLGCRGRVTSPTFTIVNSAAIVAGSIAGLLLGKFIPERFSDAMEKGAALCVLYIGVDGMLAGEKTLVAILDVYKRQGRRWGRSRPRAGCRGRRR